MRFAIGLFGTPRPKKNSGTALIRAEIEQELQPLKDWALAAAARHSDRIAVGTVFTTEETRRGQGHRRLCRSAFPCEPRRRRSRGSVQAAWP